MAKHRAAWGYRRYHRLVAEGRGQGTLSDYKPWITIHDIASKGVSSRTPGRTTGRIHHTLSRLETAFLYILDASPEVLDIREQYPLLPVTETVRIAEQAGIRHPRDNVSHYPYVMTTDFVITTETGLVARSIKQSSELDKPRVREKMEIERRYWEKRGVEWLIVTEREIDFQQARNIEWVYRSWYYDDMLPDGSDCSRIEDFFLDYYARTDMPVAEIARLTEEQFSLRSGLGLTTFQHMILENRIKLDLSRPIDLVSVRTGEGGVYSWMETYV